MTQKTNAQLVWDLNKVFSREQLDPLESLLDPKEQDKLRLQFQLIEEEVGELQDAIIEGDWEEMKDAVSDILVVTYGMAYVMGIDADKALQEVNRSNMSKICTSQEEVVATTGYYTSLGVEVSIQTVEHMNNKVFVIKSAKDQTDKEGKFYPKGKFLKNINWSKPDLFGVETL